MFIINKSINRFGPGGRYCDSPSTPAGRYRAPVGARNLPFKAVTAKEKRGTTEVSAGPSGLRLCHVFWRDKNWSRKL